MTGNSAAMPMSSGGYASEQIDLHVQCLNGEGCILKLNASVLGREVYQMVSKKLGPKKAAKAGFTSPGFTADALPNTRRARNSGKNCDTHLHLRSNRSVCGMVPHPRITCLWGRACSGGGDRDSKYINHQVFAQPPWKSRSWHLAMFSMRAWKEWPCRAIFRAWSLATTSTRA